MRVGAWIAVLALSLSLALGVAPLQAEQGIHVIVRDGDGEPIKGAEVVVAWRNGGAIQRAPLLSAKTDDVGRAVLDASRVPERPDLCVLPPTNRRKELVDSVVPYWDGEPLVVNLEPAHTIRGVVLDPDRNPVPQAAIAVSRIREGSPFGPAKFAREHLTSLDGSFEIERLPPGIYSVTATVDETDGPDTESGEVRVEAGDQVEVLLQTAPRQPRKVRVFRFRTSRGEIVYGGKWRGASSRTVRVGAYTARSSGGGGGSWTDGGAADINLRDPVVVHAFRAYSRTGLPVPAGPTTAGPFAGGSGEHEIELGAPAVLSGRLVSRTGERLVPVGLAQIEASPRP